MACSDGFLFRGGVWPGNEAKSQQACNRSLPELPDLNPRYVVVYVWPKSVLEVSQLLSL